MHTRADLQGGFLIGGWADRNRYFGGYLAGVKMYAGSALSAAEVAACIAASNPGPAPVMPSHVCLYRGPLLLGYDPRLNEAAVSPPTMASGSLEYTVIEEAPPIPTPALKLQFKDADGHGVVLADYGSLGLCGDTFATWLPMTFPAGHPEPSAPFTKKAPSRTFFFDDQAPLGCLRLAISVPSLQLVGAATDTPLPASLAEVQSAVDRLFAVVGGDQCHRSGLQWVDSDGDAIELASQADLDEAVRLASSSPSGTAALSILVQVAHARRAGDSARRAPPAAQLHPG